MKRELKLKIALILISICFSLLLLEFFLRFLNFKPWKYENEISKNNEIFQYEKKLGWISKKGFYQMTFDENKNPNSFITIEEKGNRFIENSEENKESIIFIGGSFTQGWGINDNQTFSNLIKNYFQKYNVYNFGQSGYGGVQSLLLLQEIIKEFKHPKLIIYGFIEHHEQRNVARSAWLETLLRYSKRGHYNKPQIPFATINKNNQLIIHEPKSYIEFWLREESALIVALEKFINKQISRHRKKYQDLTTKQIFIDMKKIADENKSNFLIVNLFFTNKDNEKKYEIFFNEKNLNYVNCNINLDKTFLILNDFHPNHKANVLYGKCIKDYIEKKNLLF